MDVHEPVPTRDRRVATGEMGDGRAIGVATSPRPIALHVWAPELVQGTGDAEHDPALTRRALERRMLRLIRQAGLPAAIVNGYAFGFQLDFLWPAQRLVVETDGYQFHGHRAKFERDRRRDQVLVANGYRVMRITWRQLSEEPLAVTARLATALAAGN